MIRAIIVDDELPAIGHLADMLLDSGKVHIVGQYVNSLEALQHVHTMDVDVAFLDIEMPALDGIALANRLLELNRQIDVVFATAYNKYAVEAFELNAQDYLLKPVSPDRLLKTLNRLERRTLSAPRPTRLIVNCFGKLWIGNEAGVAVKWRTGKTEELFAYLIDKASAGATKEKMMDELWGHMDEKRAVTNFNTCLYYLRKTLSQLGFSLLLSSEQGLYRLDLSQIDLDVHRYERCVATMKAISASTVAEFHEVIRNYGDGYLALNYYDWAVAKREQFDERVPQLIMHTVEYELETGHIQQAIDLLRIGLAKDSLHTGLNLALLKLYLRQNDQVGAARHFDVYKTRLKKELGLEPDEALLKILSR